MHHLRSAHARILAITLSAALVLAACGDDSSGDATTETTASEDQSTTTVADAVLVDGADSAAATLRTDLSVLLVENVVLLADVAVGAATGERPQPAEAAPAEGSEEEGAAEEPADAAEDNARDLADLVGSVLGAEAGAEAHDALLARLAALDAYGRTGGTGAEAEAAAEALARADEDLAELLAEGVAEVGTIAPESALESISEELIRVADEAIDDPDAPVDLGDAPDTAATLAAELAPLLVTTRGLEGDAEADAAVLRADLATALAERSYVVTAAASDGRASPDALGASAEAVVGALDEVLTEADAAELADLLEARADLFVEYGAAVADEDEDRRREVEARLEQNRNEIGAFFASRSEGALVAEAVAESLVPNELAQLAAVSASVGGDDEDRRLAREAAQATTDVAMTLAVALQAALTA